MFEAMREGGWGMYPTLVFGLVAIGAALRFAFRPDVRLSGFIDSMSRSVLFFALTGFVTGLIMTAKYVENRGLTGDGALSALVVGAGESIHNVALGFTVLSLVHLAVAVGRRRLDAARVTESTP